ncbi:hypothetical protein ABFS83_04G187000 [Erythranthe nasuta]
MKRRRNSTTLSPSNSMLVPYDHRQLAVVPSITAASRRGIPRGWGVEVVPRSDGSRSDTYYYEPGTGKKFKSIVAIHRYLKGADSPRRSPRNHNQNSGCRRLPPPPIQKNSKCRGIVASAGKLMRLKDEPSESNLAIVAFEKPTPVEPFILPDGWIVKEVRRKYDNNWKDKYYYEPGTGQKFRSLVAVERHLAELEENSPLSKALEKIKENRPLSKVFKLENHSKRSSPMKKDVSEENKEASALTGPPMSVNWVLASPQGDIWNPFISDMFVSDTVKQQWNNRFMLFMNDEINDRKTEAQSV